MSGEKKKENNTPSSRRKGGTKGNKQNKTVLLFLPLACDFADIKLTTERRKKNEFACSVLLPYRVFTRAPGPTITHQL